MAHSDIPAEPSVSHPNPWRFPMRVFVTGASGHIGLPVTEELLGAGHEVVGLARSDESAAKVEAAGATVLRGDLDDLDGLKAAASEADGVIHLAFKHDLMATDMEGAIATDLAVTEAFGEALAGTDKPLVNTSGTLMLAMAGVSGRAGTEDDRSPGGHRGDVENATLALADRGVRSSVVRLSPLVHSGELDKHGFGPTLIGIARDQGYAGYPLRGANPRPPGHTPRAPPPHPLARGPPPRRRDPLPARGRGGPGRLDPPRRRRRRPAAEGDRRGDRPRHRPRGQGGPPGRPRRVIQLPRRVHRPRHPALEREDARAARLGAGAPGPDR